MYDKSGLLYSEKWATNQAGVSLSAARPSAYICLVATLSPSPAPRSTASLGSQAAELADAYHSTTHSHKRVASAHTVGWLVFNGTFSTKRLYCAMQKVKSLL